MKKFLLNDITVIFNELSTIVDKGEAKRVACQFILRVNSY